eukprot:349801-Chlamydomonas_euryale.AAC.16
MACMLSATGFGAVRGVHNCNRTRAIVVDLTRRRSTAPCKLPCRCHCLGHAELRSGFSRPVSPHAHS